MLLNSTGNMNNINDTATKKDSIYPSDLDGED